MQAFTDHDRMNAHRAGQVKHPAPGVTYGGTDNWPGGRSRRICLDLTAAWHVPFVRGCQDHICLAGEAAGRVHWP